MACETKNVDQLGCVLDAGMGGHADAEAMHTIVVNPEGKPRELHGGRRDCA